MTTIKLEKILQNEAGGSLAKLIRTARTMESLTDALKAALDAELGQNLLAASVRENHELVIICSSSAWAARIRFEEKSLAAAAAAAGFSTTSLRVTVSHDR